LNDPTAPAGEPLSLVARALAYAAAGTPVFPCLPRGKSPLTAHGFHDATTDPDRIRAWWSLTPLANIAAPTGHPGFDVLEVDVRVDGSGWAAFRQARTAGLLEGWVRAVRTPSGGLHLHFPGTEQRSGSVRGQHLDFRGRGGYVLLPPSFVRSADYVGGYDVIAARTDPGPSLDWAAVVAMLTPSPAAVPAPRVPRPSGRPGSGPIPWLAAHVARQPEGNRDNALFWAACRAPEAGTPDLTPLVDAAMNAGLPEAQARRTIRSAQDTIARGFAGPALRHHPSSQAVRPTDPPARSA
jgi:hypothetical protein